ncbi:hypothetical protein MMC20_001007 [Loxospora ochrophaea]|nr:hypothetical protein [Loxospora ochrophaea]
MDDISGATFSARPPSVAQFNPKLRALPFPRQPVSVKLRSECEIDGKSSRSSSTSTHSRDPPRQFPSAPPNGGGNIYSLSENTSWSAFPSEDLHSDNSLDYTVSSNESVASLSLSTSRKAPSKAPRPPSILFPYAGFPAPPARSNAPDWRPSGSGPRGPRDAPERPRSPQRRSPTRRSPLRYESRRASRNSASCLQSSVTELRRMNSDVSALSTREREQFVNIGQASPLLEPTAEGTDTVGKDWSLIGCGKAALVNPGLTVKVGKDTFDLVQQPTGVMGRRERGTACHKMPAVQGLRLD